MEQLATLPTEHLRSCFGRSMACSVPSPRCVLAPSVIGLPFAH